MFKNVFNLKKKAGKYKEYCQKKMPLGQTYLNYVAVAMVASKIADTIDISKCPLLKVSTPGRKIYFKTLEKEKYVWGCIHLPTGTFED